MTRSFVFALAGVTVGGSAVALFVSPSAQSSAVIEPTPAPTAMPRFPSAELAELDRVVQARFAVVPRDGNFGYSRIALPQPIHGRFSPISKPEIAAVSALAKKNQRVVFSLIGHAYSAARGPKTPRIQGPLVLTSPFAGGFIDEAALKAKHQTLDQAAHEAELIAKSAPSQKDLLPLAQEVFDKTKPDEGAQAQIGEWHVIARPVPASGPQCVSCHNTMAQEIAKKTKDVQPELVSLGDPLAVALYAVSSIPDSTPALQMSQRSSP